MVTKTMIEFYSGSGQMARAFKKYRSPDVLWFSPPCTDKVKK